MAKVIRIPDIKNYTQKIVNSELILTPIYKSKSKNYITENELNLTQFTHSTIESCVVKKKDRIISVSTSYRSIVIDIWKTLPTQKILQNTKFNFKLTNEYGKKGYTWCSDIHMSFQGKNSRDTIREIINMIKINKYTIKIAIKLKTGKIIYFKL